MKNLTKLNILGVDIIKASKDEVLEYIFTNLKNQKEKYYIVTPNPEIIMLSQKDPEYKRVINEARLSVVDGVGLGKAIEMLTGNKVERIAGVDLMESICEKASHLPVSIGLLGGEAGIAERTAECLMRKYPGLKIVFVAEEWSERDLESWSKKQEARRKKQENTFLNHDSLFSIPRIDLLFVAFGSPKQEKWISENIQKLPVKVVMGVGGAFDFISRNVPRAPKFIRDAGFEWLYRLIRQPWRWRRQIELTKFIYLVIREKLISH